MGKANTPDEQVARQELRDVRNKILEQIEAYRNGKFNVDEIEQAALHSWSVLGRLEDEFDTVPADEDLVEQLEDNKSEYYDNDQKRPMVRIPERDYNKLLNRLTRLEAKTNRVYILDLLSKANRKLGQQMLDGLKMETEKVKVDYIEISYHAAVLRCFKDVLYISLRRLGYTDGDMQKLAKEMKRIEKDYPLLEEDKATIMKRLFGEPEEIIDVEYTPVLEGEELLKAINAEVSGKQRKRRSNA